MKCEKRNAQARPSLAGGSASDEQATDYGNDAIARGEREQLTRCAYCGSLYDPRNEGHTDENTNLSFCDAPCEMHCSWETGLPKTYVLS